MKIGLFPAAATPIATPEFLTELAHAADDCEFHSIWLPEHVVLFDEYASQYPYSRDGKLPIGPEFGILEPFGVVSFLAGASQRVRLGTGICIVPQRNPVYTAKLVATCDWLSRGRFDFGVGVGWLKEEYEVLGVPFEKRGARCRSYVETMKRLWCDDVSTHTDEFYALPKCRQYPKPVQTPHPPIHFGGESAAAIERAADLGQGFMPYGLRPDALAPKLELLDRALDRAGRKRSDILLTACPPMRAQDEDTLRAYADLGVDQVVLMALASSPESMRQTVETLAERLVVPALRM